LALQALLHALRAATFAPSQATNRGLELALDLELARVHRDAAAGCL
jgi:hypothetical protein